MLDNPVADLSSNLFLLVYALVCVAALVAARWYVVRSDASTAMGEEPLPATFDPFAIAYLRGGANELVRFAVFDLTRHGLLELSPAVKKKRRYLRRTLEAPNTVALHPICVLVYAYFDAPHTVEELFASDVPARVDAAFAPERSELERRQLLTSEATHDASRTARLAAGAVILLLGAYRIWYALAMGHRNIGFTILIMIMALIALLLLTVTRRLSRRGLQYVAKLRASLGGDASAAPEPTSPAFPIMVAAGGLMLLAATPYADLQQSFGRQAAANGASGTSCSGGCGSHSSDSSSSSCGGGGGCGGGCGG
jgi:uncharacterized protein (TIGR04222 family)